MPHGQYRRWRRNVKTGSLTSIQTIAAGMPHPYDGRHHDMTTWDAPWWWQTGKRFSHARLRHKLRNQYRKACPQMAKTIEGQRRRERDKHAGRTWPVANTANTTKMTAFQKPSKELTASRPRPDLRGVGGIRDHVHQYPHSPGGAVEKHGASHIVCGTRRSSTNESRATGTTFGRADPSDLRDRWEQEVTSALMIPTIGEIQAYCKSWVERVTPATRQSGVEVELEFVEDQSQAFLVNSIIQITSTTRSNCGN